MLAVLYRILDVFNVLVERLFLTAASLSLVAIMVVVASNALSRYFFGTSFRGSFELSEYILLYFTFLSAPYLIRVNGHATFDIFVTLASERVRKWMNVCSLLLGLLICVILTKYAFDVTVSNYQRNIVVQNNLMTPRYLLMGVIPVGGALMCTELLQKLFSLLLGKEDRQDLSLTLKQQ